MKQRKLKCLCARVGCPTSRATSRLWRNRTVRYFSTRTDGRSGGGASKPAELEMLDRAARRGVIVPPRLVEHKGRAEHRPERGGIVPDHRQTAAALGPVRRESPDDKLSARPQHLANAIGVGRAIVGRGEEVKGRAVVPDVVALRWLPGGDVGDDPVDRAGARAEPLARLGKCLVREVEDADRAEALVEQRVDQA